MKMRNLGSRENLVFKSSTNFSLLFELKKSCDIDKFLLSANAALEKAEIFSCYVANEAFYRLNTPPTVKREPKLTIQALIERELARTYSTKEHWINAIFHIETNSLLISMEHSLGDVSTLITFMEEVISHYHNNTIEMTPLSPPIESLLPLNNVDKLDCYGINKGSHKARITVTIPFSKTTLEELFKNIHQSYLENFEIQGLQFDITIDLRKFYEDVLKNKLGYYSHMLTFNIEEGFTDSFYPEFKKSLPAISSSKLPESFRDFFAQKQHPHKMACSIISEKSFSNIDKKIIANISAYGNAFYFNQHTFTTFLFITIFNNNLNICFCHDTRIIKKDQASKFINTFCEKTQRK